LTEIENLTMTHYSVVGYAVSDFIQFDLQ